MQKTKNTTMKAPTDLIWNNMNIKKNNAFDGLKKL